MGGTFVEPITIPFGNTASAPTDPTKVGYKFLGWYLVFEEQWIKYSFSNVVRTDVTLYAKWEKLNIEVNKYIVDGNFITNIQVETNVTKYLEMFEYDDCKRREHRQDVRNELSLANGKEQ